MTAERAAREFPRLTNSMDGWPIMVRKTTNVGPSAPTQALRVAREENGTPRLAAAEQAKRRRELGA